MATVLLLLHILIAIALIGVVLLQRSEGGALGIGGGGGGGFMTGRGAANFLTRATAGLAAGFFATSLILSLVGARMEGPRSVLEAPPGKGQTKGTDGTSDGSKLPDIDLKNVPDLPGDTPKTDTPKVPQSK
jgi:preprotein translocase subunit SecG